MDTKKKLQEATEKVKDSTEKQNSSLKRLKNEGLGRTLTDQEIAAVEWYVEKVLSVSPTDKKIYKDAVRSLIEDGGIKNIVKKFQEFYGKGATVAFEHIGKGMHRPKIVRNLNKHISYRDPKEPR